MGSRISQENEISSSSLLFFVIFPLSLFFCFSFSSLVSTSSAFLFSSSSVSSSSIYSSSSSSSLSTSRRASKGVILSVTDDNSNIGANANSPLLGRTIELTEKEDSTERMCQITFQENGVITWARKYDSTSPKDLTGSWTDRS